MFQVVISEQRLFNKDFTSNLRHILNKCNCDYNFYKFSYDFTLILLFSFRKNRNNIKFSGLAIKKFCFNKESRTSSNGCETFLTCYSWSYYSFMILRDNYDHEVLFICYFFCCYVCYCVFTIYFLFLLPL